MRRLASLCGWLALAAALLPSPAAAQTASICAIQGSGFVPAMLGARVTTSGVVTADFTATALQGFSLQDPGCDGSALTSDGIWVSTGSRRPAVTVGHRVTVTGRVSNDFGLTQIVLEGVTGGGPFPGSIEAERLSPPADPSSAAAYLEAREGMLVSLQPSRVVGATNRFGEAYLMPDSSGVSRLFRGDAEGRKLGLASPSAWIALDHGERVTSAVGPLTYTFGEFKVLLSADRPPGRERPAARVPQAPPSPPDRLTLATYNLENFFDPFDDPGKDDAEWTPSPAQYEVEVARRARSIARLLGSPDVLGVQEAEKVEVLLDLAAHPELGGAGYRPVLVEGADGRGIDVGLLYNSGRLWLRSAEARPACTSLRPAEGQPLPCTLPGGGGFLLFARPPLVVRLETLDTRERVTVVVNHFKSQRGDDPADGPIRLAMADHVRALAEELRMAEPETPVVVLGDLNDFEDSAPLSRLTADGRLVDLHRSSRERPYTYLFQGVSEVLDYILVEPSLLPRVVEFRALHINADFAHPGPGAPLDAGHRASDHDPLLLTLSRR